MDTHYCFHIPVYYYCNVHRTGVKFAELTYQQSMDFQSNILRTILQIEKTIFDLAEQDKGKVLIVCDRGAMDPSACEL